VDETYRTIITIYDIFNKQHEVVVYPLSATEIDNTDNNHWIRGQQFSIRGVTK